jgi:hypothetical protein
VFRPFPFIWQMKFLSSFLVASAYADGVCFECWNWDQTLEACIPKAVDFELTCGLSDFTVTASKCVYEFDNQGDDKVDITTGGAAGECEFKVDPDGLDPDKVILTGKYKDCGAVNGITDEDDEGKQFVTEKLTLAEVANSFGIMQYPPVDLTCTLALTPDYQFTITTTVAYQDIDVAGSQTAQTVDPTAIFSLHHDEDTFVVGSDVTVIFRSTVVLDDYNLKVNTCTVANDGGESFPLVSAGVPKNYVDARWVESTGAEEPVVIGDLMKLSYRAFKFSSDGPTGTHTITCTLALSNACTADPGPCSLNPDQKCYPVGRTGSECRDE